MWNKCSESIIWNKYFESITLSIIIYLFTFYYSSGPALVNYGIVQFDKEWGTLTRRKWKNKKVIKIKTNVKLHLI